MHASPQRTARALATLCAGAATSVVLTATPVHADPDVDAARDRLSAVQDKRDETVSQSRRLSKSLVQAQAVLLETRGQISAHEVALDETEALIAAESEDTLNLEALAEASRVIQSDDPTEALAEAREDAQEVSLAPQTAQALESRIASLREREARQGTRVERLEVQAKKRGASLRDLRSRVEAAGERLQEARDAAREAARASRAAARTRATQAASAEAVVPAAPAASGGASAAVAYAMAQVGDAYSYGATGESAFDCSGLTMRAWAQAGLSLPHSSGAQMGSGTPVSTSALQPGDLVFYYSPVSHVGIYVGNGQLVHAANPSTGVQLTSAFSMPISGAVRPG